MSYSFRLEDALRKLGHDPKKHLPEHGVRGQWIDLVRPDVQNVYVWVMTKTTAKERGITQRTRATCPHCQRAFALGNLRQHMQGQRKRAGRVLGCVETLGDE